MPRVGRVCEVDDSLVPYRVLDGDGAEVAAVTEFLREMVGRGSPASTLRSYAFDLLRWFRFLWAVEVAWDRAGRLEARDFLCGSLRHPSPGAAAGRAARHPRRVGEPDHRQAVSGPDVGGGHAQPQRDRGPRVLRSPRRAGARAGAQPIPGAGQAAQCASRSDAAVAAGPDRRVSAAGNRTEYRARSRTSCSTSCSPSWTPTGTGPSSRCSSPPVCARQELLGRVRERINVGDQTIGVIRKGTRALQWVPASPDAFVWLRRYQQQIRCPSPGWAHQSIVVDAAPPVSLVDLPRLSGYCAGRTPRWERTGPCTTSGIPHSSGWRTTRICRSPTCSG